MRIFISYSHNEADTPIARYLADGLRAAGIEVWHDESQAAGVTLRDDIEQAIIASDHAVFIVSKLWLASRWCQVEVDRFYRRDRTKVRRIPVFREPPERLKLPPELIGEKGITWLEDDPHHQQRLWQVYCAIQGQETGSADGWAAAGAKLAQGVAPEAPVVRKPASLGSLRCDRDPQWTTVTDVEPEPSHDVLIVPGAAGQAHNHFNRRIREMLDPTPPRGIVLLDWDNRRPTSSGEFRAALARNLGVSIDALDRELAERMADSNLVLIHPCLSAFFGDDALVAYYTVWLPELLRQVKPRMSLKCVQPVEWPAEQGGVGAVLAWLRITPTTTMDGKPEAEAFIARVRDETPEAMRCIRLRDLMDITDEDLDQFCQKEKLTGPKRTWLLAKIKSRRPRNSAEVLEAIDAFLTDARSVS